MSGYRRLTLSADDWPSKPSSPADVSWPACTGGPGRIVAYSYGDVVILTRPYDQELDAATPFGMFPEFPIRPIPARKETP